MLISPTRGQKPSSSPRCRLWCCVPSCRLRRSLLDVETDSAGSTPCPECGVAAVPTAFFGVDIDSPKGLALGRNFLPLVERRSSKGLLALGSLMKLLLDLERGVFFDAETGDLLVIEGNDKFGDSILFQSTSSALLGVSDFSVEASIFRSVFKQLGFVRRLQFAVNKMTKAVLSSFFSNGMQLNSRG